IMSGEEDPVGGMGKGIREVADDYKALGIREVTLKLYPGDRHELYHEADRYRVFFDIMEFMREHGADGD
ncbi:MAG: alpha/beta hydrolase, partial [Lachnospiraceae bacterium]|nr:alpha/beta hydrolase [Lachnospiraceae bacterium]